MSLSKIIRTRKFRMRKIILLHELFKFPINTIIGNLIWKYLPYAHFGSIFLMLNMGGIFHDFKGVSK